MQYCYVHDGNGGNNVKTRAERNEIYYNWIEGAYYHELELIGPDGQSRESRSAKTPTSSATSSIRVTPRARIPRSASAATARGRPSGAIASSTTRSCSATRRPRAAFRLFDGIESVEMHNNVLYRQGGGAVTVLTDGDASWVNGR